MRKYIKALLTVLIFGISACGLQSTPQQQDVLITLPAIVIKASRDNCPSIEAEVGMTIAWENVDTISLTIKIELLDENGKVTATGLSVLDPETVYSTQFYEVGTYYVYCTDNADTPATITVK